MRIPLKSLILPWLLALTLIVNLGPAPASAENSGVVEDFRPVLQTYRIVNEEYLKQENIDKGKLVKGAIDGMLEVLPDGFDGKGRREIEVEEFSWNGLQPKEALQPTMELYQKLLDETREEEYPGKKDLLKAAISGMLEVTGDSYARVYTEEEFQELRRSLENGVFVGFGLELKKAEGPPRVLGIHSDSPASRSSIRTGDLFLRIDGKSTERMSCERVIDLLSGEKGEKTSLRIEHRNGEREKITLVRSEFEVTPLESELLPGSNIALLDINLFSSATHRELESFLKNIKERFLEPRVEDELNNQGELGKYYCLLGTAHAKNEGYEKALKYYKYAKEIFEKEEIEVPVSLARTYDNLGSVYQKEEKFTEAIEYHEKALASYRDLSNEKVAEIAKTYGNIGTTHFESGKNSKAKEYYGQAAELLEGVSGSERVYLAQVYSDLGVVLENQGKIDESIELQENALGILEEAPQESPAAFANIYGRLASAHREKGEIEQTMDYYEKRSRARREASDAEARSDLSSYGNLKWKHGTEEDKIKSVEEYEKQIMALQGFSGIIVDLRNNSGGSQSSAISSLMEFFEEGPVAKSLRWDGEISVYEAMGDAFPNFPSVVLINNRTASASEVFAVAIQDRERGVLVGRRSYGKPYGQTIYKMSDGFYVELTVREFLAPSGKEFPKEGLEPDLSSPDYPEDIPLAIEWILEN